MNNKKKILACIIVILAVISNIFIWKFLELDGQRDMFSRLLMIALIDITSIVVIFNMDAITALIKNILYDNKLIFNLAKSDFRTKFAGSYLGIIWAFVQPVITILVYWFVFEKGLRSGADSKFPFVLWLMCGLVPWFFFSEALGSGTNSLIEYSYLVKKVVFKIDILPIVKVISAIFVHFFFVGFIILFHVFYKYYPDLYTLQVIYYIICTFALVLSLSYMTSALVVFFKDLNQIIGIILQIGIWLTPILWDAGGISAAFDTALKINPMYYIVSGFRDSLLNKVWFWDKPVWTVCFWSTVIILFILGRNIFKKLQVHFADVL